MKKKQKTLVLVILIVGALILFNNDYGVLKQGRTAYVEHTENMVLKLTFDDPSNPWQDTSPVGHIFQATTSNVKWANKSVCKMNGCLDLTSNSRSDYLAVDNILFTTENGMTICYWNYLTDGIPSGSNPYGIMQMFPGSPDNYGSIQGNVRFNINYGGFGTSSRWPLTNGSILYGSEGSEDNDAGSTWAHHCVQYNPVTGQVKSWKNGQLIRTFDRGTGTLYIPPGDTSHWIIGRFEGVPFAGYLDQIRVWNTGDIPESEIVALYEAERFGTPPDIDLYIQDIRYEIPYDWATAGHPLITGGVMPIMVTFSNAGSQQARSARYNIEIDGISICSDSITLAAMSSINITCNWNTAEGFRKGSVSIDTNNNNAEDNEGNNELPLYIPFMDRPWFLFSRDEWNSETKPMCAAATTTSDPMAEASCGWTRTFHNACSTTGFPHSGGNSVDPYGGCTRTQAMGCLYDDYNGPTCEQAMSYLRGWANVPISSYTNVQAMHQLMHVGIAMDIMQPYMSQADWNDLATKYEALCQMASNKVAIEGTSENLIRGDNGYGFGSGMGALCYTLIGASKNNPTLIYKPTQGYYGDSLIDLWERRETSYLRAYKNDPYAQYQEGWNYKQYAEPHLQEIWYFRNKYNLMDSTEYQNAMCAMGREIITQLTDHSYNSITLRSQQEYAPPGSMFRAIQRGDSPSYGIDGSLWISWDLLLYEALNCNDQDVKANLLWLRQKIYDVGDGRRTYPLLYLLPELRAQVTPQEPENTMPKFIYDNANDIAYWRNHYSYVDDTILQVDGGEEKGGGHSQAQGYYLYALGEPFFDYEQVPFEDDVRTDPWKNGVSFVNAPQSTAGDGGLWLSQCGQAAYNQYSGMQSCPVPIYPQDYPEYRQFPLHYGGDLEDYIGTTDGEFGGVYVWRPYAGATQPVQEFFVKFGDIVVKRTVVTGSPTGSVYHNFINANDEFTLEQTGTKFTMQRVGTTRTMDTDVVYSSVSVTLGGGNSGVLMCYCKTSCSENCGGSSNYRRMYYLASSPDLDMIHYHHWYTSTPTDIQAVGAIDKGLRFGQSYIIFDTSNDGKVQFNNYESNGWAIAYNEATGEYAAFNATYLRKFNSDILEATSAVSMYLKDGVITKNTMTRNIYTDQPRNVVVSAYGIPDGPICEPIDESCNGQDDDCDELIDENLQRTCSVNTNPGTQTCINSAWSTCVVTSITTYSCVNYACVVDVNGLYSLQSSCSAACQAPQNNTQNQTPTQNTTPSPPPAPPPAKETFIYYGCNQDNVCIQDSNGKYLTTNCNNACKPKADIPWAIIIVFGVILFMAIKLNKKRRR